MEALNGPKSVRALSDKYVLGRIGVVTVTFGSRNVLPDFFESLNRQTYRDFLLFSVDNASTDSTVEQLRAYRGCEHTVIANDKNLGVAAGNNQGIRAAIDAGCEYILLINNDVVFESDLFLQLINGLGEHNCQMTTPIIYYNDRANVVWYAGGSFEPILGYRPRHIGDGMKDSGQFAKPKTVEYCPTCCIMMRSEVFYRIGLMDDRYFVYSDDVDFMYRARRASLRTYLIPEAKVWHKVSSLTGGNLSDFALYYGARGRTLFLCKHLGKFRGTLWTWLYICFYWLRAFCGLDTWHRSGVRRNGTRIGRRVGLADFQELRIQ
jgi:hypothetical protein